MALLYVAAEAFELQPFAASLENLRRLKWPLAYAFEGALNGHRAILIANGAGPRLARKAAETAFRAVTGTGLSSSRIEAIASVGFCGALDPKLKVNEIVAGSEILDSATGQTFPCAGVSSTRSFTTGVLLSQDRIANDAGEKRQLFSRGAIAVEMEAAAVASYAQRVGLPFMCIKVVSDDAEESFPFDLNEMRTSEGRIARGKIGLYVLKHPALLPKLLHLKRRSDHVARTLGDFLVSCTISSESGGSLDG